MDNLNPRDESSDDEDSDEVVLDPHMKPYERPQKVQFSTNEEANSVELFSRDVTIIPSSGEHETGSSRIKVKNVVDFSWEFRFYQGQLLALHLNSKFLAYGIKIGKTGGVVRVVNRDTGNRILLNKMEGMVQDIAFAHIPDQVMVACVDEYGTMSVYNIDDKYDKLTSTLLMHVVQPQLPGCSPPSFHRVFWCPFTPESDELKRVPSEVDHGKLLCLTQGSRARLFNVGMVHERCGSETVMPAQLQDQLGYLEICEHTKPIVDASFSPDGTAVATASQDGDVKFFQVDMVHNNPIRCLHEWQPHPGKQLSTLMFLDSHRWEQGSSDAQFWKFVITGADDNTELKLWSCVSWLCLQTIRFRPVSEKRKTVLKMARDITADYVLLTDVYNKLLYVMQLFKYPEPYHKVAYVRSVTELPLPYPILSFVVIDAGIRNFKSPSLEYLTNADHEDELSQYIQALVVRMYLVQPKSLQECNLAFQPPALEDCLGGQDNQLDTLTHESIAFGDALSDLSLHDESVRLDHPPHQLTLLAPNMFTSPGKDASTSPKLPRLLDAPLSSSPTLGQHMTGVAAGVVGAAGANEEPLATSDRFHREGFASGGSSPSREVQEIFSLNNSEHNSYYEDKGLGEAAVAQLHLMPTPPAVEVHYEAATAAQNGDLKPSAGDSDRWPPIPLALASEARHSVEGNITARRRSVGGDTGGPVRLLIQPIELKKANKDTLYKIFATDDSVPKSIYINKPADPSKRCTWATLEYEDLREAESVIRKHHLKSPHYWQIRVEQPEAVELPEQVEVVQYAGSPAGDSAPEQRPPSVIIMDEHAGGDQLHASSYSRADVGTVSSKEYAVLLEIAEQQRLQLQQLSGEVAALCKALEDKPPRHKTLLAQIGKLLTKQSSETSLQFQEWQATRGELDRKKQEDAFLGAISQLVTAAVTTQVPAMVREHVQATLQPQLCQAILQVVEPMQSKLHLDVTKQVASLDQHISKQISQLLNSKVICENMSQSAVAAMKPASQACFTEVYTQTILPRFEKACNQMFRQVNETFSKGTHEFVSQLEESVKAQHQQQDKNVQVLSQLQALTQAVGTDTDLLKQQVATAVGAEVAAQLHRSLAGVQDGLTKCVRDNMARGFQRQQATIQSKVMEGLRSITPAPSVVDAQTRILQLVAQDDINAAFQMALSAADLTLVVLVCEKVDPDALFSQSPCPLQQNVILSLIQQLSADMDNHTDTKHKYLLEAVMNLDIRNPDTRAHIPAVIARLQQQLQTFITNSTNPKMTSKVKQLLFSTRALLNT